MTTFFAVVGLLSAVVALWAKLVPSAAEKQQQSLDDAHATEDKAIDDWVDHGTPPQ